MTKSKRKSLHERIRKHGKLEFRNIGAKCPCGFVYTNGFSDVSKAFDINDPVENATNKSFSICTGCLKPIRIDMTTGSIEIIPEIETMLWPQQMHDNIRDIQKFLKEYKATMPS